MILNSLYTFSKSEKGVQTQALVIVVLIGMFVFFLVGVVYHYGNLQSCDIAFSNYEQYKLDFCSKLILEKKDPDDLYWSFSIQNRCFRSGFNVKGVIDEVKVAKYCTNIWEVYDGERCETARPDYDDCSYLK